MKKLIYFLLATYDRFFYNLICRKFQNNAVECLPELGEEIVILEIGFGKGTGAVNKMYPYKVRSVFLHYIDEPMYYAEILTEKNIKGYLYSVKRGGGFVDLFYTGKEEGIDFSFSPEGIITKNGKELILSASRI